VTKTDTLGLGLLVIGLALKGLSIGTLLLLLVIWLLVLASSAVNCQLLATYNLEMEGTDAEPPSANPRSVSRDL